MHRLEAPRLYLLPLSQEQIETLHSDPATLERELGLPLARSVLDQNVERALNMKLEKIRAADAAMHAWFTYWLIALKAEQVGAGLLGFKGYPDQAGSTEIGYGIALEYQGRGYMSEAVARLLDWAFSHPFCRAVTATGVKNPASRRLLEKLGFELVDEGEGLSSWRMARMELMSRDIDGHPIV